MNESWRELFRNPADPATPSELDALETRIGRKLPPSLRELYGVTGGGKFAKTLFVDDQGTEFEIDDLIGFRPTALDRGFADRYLDLVKQRRLLPEHLVPFATGGGGDFYAVDTTDGSVVFYAMDTAMRPQRRVAASLSEFLEGLDVEDYEDDGG